MQNISGDNIDYNADKSSNNLYFCRYGGANYGQAPTRRTKAPRIRYNNSDKRRCDHSARG